MTRWGTNKTGCILYQVWLLYDHWKIISQLSDCKQSGKGVGGGLWLPSWHVSSAFHRYHPCIRHCVVRQWSLKSENCVLLCQISVTRSTVCLIRDRSPSEAHFQRLVCFRLLISRRGELSTRRESLCWWQQVIVFFNYLSHGPIKGSQ